MIIKKVEINRTVLDLKKLPRGKFPEFAFLGRSNVGKSSLLNTLLNRKKLAGVSKDPGKTRTINYYMINDRFFFVDMPGYGYAKVSKAERKRWEKLIDEYIRTREQLTGIVHLIDSKVGPTEDDVFVLYRLSRYGKDFIVALTKADKIGFGARRDVIKALEGEFYNARVVDVITGRPMVARLKEVEDCSIIPAIFFSAKTGEGKEAIWKWIEQRIKGTEELL